MRYALALLPFCLSCAAPNEPIYIPIVEIPHDYVAIPKEEVENIKQPLDLLLQKHQILLLKN